MSSLVAGMEAVLPLAAQSCAAVSAEIWEFMCSEGFASSLHRSSFGPTTGESICDFFYFPES